MLQKEQWVWLSMLQWVILVSPAASLNQYVTNGMLVC